MAKQKQDSQPELFNAKEYEETRTPSTPSAQSAPSKPFTMTLVQDGKKYIVTDKNIDELEKSLGKCENDDGVGLWDLLRRLAKDGVKEVNLI